MLIKYKDLVNEFSRVLKKYGMNEELAIESSKLFADNTMDGVYSHGINRFPRLISYIKRGYINVNLKPTKISSVSALERWDGNLGMGNLNAKFCMDRAIVMSKIYGVGIVALGNTNHWMRGGAYGWQAADAGCVGICWTNTMPNMPAWGTKEPKIGNNPLIMSIPRSNGNHVVIDCAMSQFSYGKIEEYRLKGSKLPVPGGYDMDGNISSDPIEIENSGRVLPIGFWKGSGLSIALDLIATVLSGGNSTYQIGNISEDEYGLSQVFIAISPSFLGNQNDFDNIINDVIDDIKSSTPSGKNKNIYYPGERSIQTRKRNFQDGIPIDKEIWKEIQLL